MSEFVRAIEPWADSGLATLWRASWQGGIALAVAWAIARYATFLSPRAVCWVWRLACVKLLVALVWVQPLAIPVWSPAIGAIVATPSGGETHPISATAVSRAAERRRQRGPARRLDHWTGAVVMAHRRGNSAGALCRPVASRASPLPLRRAPARRVCLRSVRTGGRSHAGKAVAEAASLARNAGTADGGHLAADDSLARGGRRGVRRRRDATDAGARAGPREAA